MMLVIKEEREGRQILTRWVGRGSNWQVEDLDFRTRSDISVTVGSRKLDNKVEGGAEVDGYSALLCEIGNC